MRRSQDEQAQRLQIMRENRQRSQDLTSLTANEILERVGALDDKQKQTARIVGIYTESVFGFAGVSPIGIGFEGVAFVGVDRVTGKKVVA